MFTSDWSKVFRQTRANRFLYSLRLGAVVWIFGTGKNIILRDQQENSYQIYWQISALDNCFVLLFSRASTIISLYVRDGFSSSDSFGMSLIMLVVDAVVSDIHCSTSSGEVVSKRRLSWMSVPCKLLLVRDFLHEHTLFVSSIEIEPSRVDEGLTSSCKLFEVVCAMQFDTKIHDWSPFRTSISKRTLRTPRIGAIFISGAFSFSFEVIASSSVQIAKITP